jgi:putative oxidoreductase
MRAIETAARLVLGGIFLVFAADFVLHFMPELPFTDAGGRYLEALLATGYMFPLIKVVEVAAAVLIVTRRFAPLGVVLVAPVVLNIALYHLVLDPNGAAIAAILVGCEAFLLWTYRAALRPLFAPQPSWAPEVQREPAAHAFPTGR